MQGSTTRELARLSFHAVTNEHSAIVPLTFSQLVAERPGGALVANTETVEGRVFIVAAEPLLDIACGPLLTLYGHPAASYGLQYRTNLLGEGAWAGFRQFTLLGRWTQLIGLPTPAPAVFYRAYELLPFDLSLRSFGPDAFALTLRGQTGSHYFLRTATSLSGP